MDKKSNNSKLQHHGGFDGVFSWRRNEREESEERLRG